MAIVIKKDDIKLYNPDSSPEDDIIFDIRFECSAILKKPLRWEVTYVTSSHSYDQVLANTIVGPVAVGTSRFILRADPPKLEDLPSDEIMLAALLVQALYNDQEFFRIGYNILVHKFPDNMSEENIDYKQLTRCVSLGKDDIITKNTKINWN